MPRKRARRVERGGGGGIVKIKEFCYNMYVCIYVGRWYI